jgi:hypothetical protein
MNFIKHIEPNCRQSHRREPSERGVRSLSRLVWRPLLVSLCFAVAVVMATQAGVGTSQAAAPGAIPIGIQLLRSVVHVGDSVPLAAAGVNDTKAHFSWRLLRRPFTSRAKILNHKGLEASFLADVPGTYVVELTLRVGPRSATATLSVTTAQIPIVAVNTIDNVNGKPGMTVNENPLMPVSNSNCCFYADNSKGTEFQILVLDRNSLEEYQNYNLPATSSGISTMETNFKALPNTDLVFVALPASAAVPNGDIGTLNSALGTIGGVVPESWNLPTGIAGITPPTAKSSSGQLESMCWASNTFACFLSPESIDTISWTKAEPSGGGSSNVGAFSVIGVPGMQAGNAWGNVFYDSVVQGRWQQGALVGYLTPGVQPGATVNDYVFVFGADQYVVVDSCMDDGTSTCAIGVGEQLVPQTDAQTGITTWKVTWQQTFDPDPGVNGLHVLVLDRITLTPLTEATVTSTSQLVNLVGLNYSPPYGGHFESEYPGNSPNGYNSDRTVVVIQSVGTLTPLPPCLTTSCPAPTPVTPTPITYADDPALQVIDQLGGTPETFAAAIQQGLPYALVGVAGNLPWHGRGIESSPVISAGAPCTIGLNQPCVINPNQPGQSRGVLSRDRMARYTPQADDPTGAANLELAPIIYQNPTPWPYAAGDPNATYATISAIGYIAYKLGVTSYCDIRSGYLDLNQTWTDYITLIPAAPPTSQEWQSNTSCPPSTTSIPDPTTWTDIESQLSNEFRWVQFVKTFINNMTAPLDANLSTTSVDVKTIEDTISQSINVPGSSDVSLDWLSLFNAMTSVASAVPGIPYSSELGLASSTGYLVADLLENPSSASGGSGSPAYNIQVQADQLAQQLTDEQSAQVNAMLRLETILLYDYGKLFAVGDNVQSGAWGITDDDIINVESILEETTAQAVYSALLPHNWQVYNLKASWPPCLLSDGTPCVQPPETLSNSVGEFICVYNSDGVLTGVNPFVNALPANQFNSQVQMLNSNQTTTTVESATLEVWTFANVYGPSFSTAPPVTAPMPSTSLTTDIFGTATDPTNNLVQGAAYPPAWYRQTYNPPALVTCNFDVNSGQSRAAPVIGPSAAAETGG